jgi:phenylacetic acid degradation protein
MGMTVMTPPSNDIAPRVYAFKDRVPVVDRESFVHPSAVLIGDVTVGRHCYIGPGASLRGDFGTIVVGDGVNIQDNCVLHCFPERQVVVEANGHIGHGAVLHGCVIRHDVLVGIHAVIMDGVEVGAESIIGAMSFLPANKTFSPRSMIRGTPAEIVRALSDAEVAAKKRATEAYQQLASDSLATMTATAAKRPDESTVTDPPRGGPDAEGRRRVGASGNGR